MDTQKRIFDYWRDRLVNIGKYWLDEGEGVCFACGTIGFLERCHILARCCGGSDETNNLHLLCPECHIESEGISGEIYNRWFLSKNPSNSASLKRKVSFAVFVAQSIKSGENTPADFGIKL